jgi:hypothetical protein
VTGPVANEQISWETEEGSCVNHSGSVRFDRNPDGSTRVDLKMSYHPPAGILGDVVAKLFNRDVNSIVTTHLKSFKDLLEHGRCLKRGQEVTLAEIAKDVDPVVLGHLSGQGSARDESFRDTPPALAEATAPGGSKS